MQDITDKWIDRQSLKDIAYCDMYRYILRQIIDGVSISNIYYKTTDVIYLDRLNKKEYSSTTLKILGMDELSQDAKTLDKYGLNIINIPVIESTIKRLIYSNRISIIQYRNMQALELNALIYTIYIRLLYGDLVNIENGYKNILELLRVRSTVAPSYIGSDNKVYFAYYSTKNKDTDSFGKIELIQRTVQGYIAVLKLNIR